MKASLFCILILPTVFAISVNEDELRRSEPSIEQNVANIAHASLHTNNSQTLSYQHEPVQLESDSVDLESLDPDYWSKFPDDSSDYDDDEEETDQPEAQGLIRRGLENVAIRRKTVDLYTYDDYQSESLLNISKRRISPRPGLPAEYFNISEFRSYRPSDDQAYGWNGSNPLKNDDLWLHSHKQGHCILGGIGKRPIDWQPKIVKDFFEIPFKNKSSTLSEYYTFNIPNFANFWSKDPATGKWRSFSRYIVSTESGGARDNPKMWTYTMRRIKGKHYLNEQCRRRCQSCYRAAKDTGAEQFICMFKGGRRMSHYCEAAMVMGDPTGGDKMCYKRPHNWWPPYMCGELNFAQEGAPRNPYPTVTCRDYLPCEGSECSLGNHTVLIATGRRCLLGMSHTSNRQVPFFKSYKRPRWGSLGHQSLADAMKDKSIRLYYTDMSTNPGSFEKAVIIGTEFACTNWQKKRHRFLPLKLHFPDWLGKRWEATEQMKIWKDWKEDSPVPSGWMELHYFNWRLAKYMYRGSVGFGTIPGGTYMNASDPKEIQHWRK